MTTEIRVVRHLTLVLPLLMFVAGCAGEAAGPVDPTSPVSDAATAATATSTAAASTAAATTTTTTTTTTITTAGSLPTSTSTPTTVPDAADEPLGEQLIGRWAHYDVVAYEDGLIKTLIVSYGFNDFTEVDGEIVDTARFCFSEQLTDQPIETELSDAATQAIKPPSTSVDVDVVDGALRIRRPATPTPVGIRLDDPANETLPTDPDDPRIVDDDGDGRPGITVSIRVGEDLAGELYIARREIFAYEAFLVEPDLLSGTVTDDSEQLVIGASDPIFAGSGADWVQYPDLSKSPIILARVGADWDCDRLAAERDRLFPPTPDIDW